MDIIQREKQLQKRSTDCQGDKPLAGPRIVRNNQGLISRYGSYHESAFEAVEVFKSMNPTRRQCVFDTVAGVKSRITVRTVLQINN